MAPIVKKRKLLRTRPRDPPGGEPAGDGRAKLSSGPKRRRAQGSESEGQPGPKRRRLQDAEGEGQPAPKVDPTSVFIRGLPESTTDANLRRWLEVQIGPTVTCFVIRGDYGLATFKSADDARRCLQELQGVEFDGSPLRLEAAKPKRHRPKVPAAPAAGAAASTSTAAAANSGKQQQKMDLRVVQLSGVPDQVGRAALRTWTEKQLPGGCGIEVVKRMLGVAGSFVVQFRKEANARRAVGALNGATLQGHPISATFRALARSREASKAGRLIVRNLAFSATEMRVRQAFAPMGSLVEVHLPTKEGTDEKRGFAFVQFADLAAAERAVAELNGTKICGRTVAVDWAVDSRLYSGLQSDAVKKTPQFRKEGTDHAPAEREDPKDAKAAVEEEGEDEDEDQDEEENDEEEEPGARGKDALPENAAAELKRMKHLLGEGWEDKDEQVVQNDTAKSNEKPQELRKPGFDVEEKRTLFVRNVPFDATADDLKEVLGKYGKIIFVNTVADPKGQNPHRGSAFVKFADMETAEKVLKVEEEANAKIQAISAVSRRNRHRELPAVEGFGISLKGRRLVISQAMTPKEVAHAQMERKPKKGEAMREKAKWKYLLTVGDITEGMDEWNSLSNSEKMQRTASSKERRWRIGNSNFLLHPNRLSIRNLPQRVDASKLRQVVSTFLMGCELPGMSWGANTSKKEKMLATQRLILKATLVRSEDRRDADNVRRSKGYGFMEFQDHDIALKVLEFLNNNNEAFGGPKRPIVQFAIEDNRKLKMQKELYERHAHKLLAEKEKSSEAGDKRKKKKQKKEGVLNRGARQREKRRKEKAEALEREKVRAAHEAARERRAEMQRRENEIKKKFRGKPMKAMADAETSAKIDKLRRPAWELQDDFELKAMEKFRR